MAGRASQHAASVPRIDPVQSHIHPAALTGATAPGAHPFTPGSPPLAHGDALRELVNSLPWAIAMFDREMRCLAASPRWRIDCRVPSETVLIGRAYGEVFTDIPEHWKLAHLRGLAGETVVMEEEQFRRPDGQAQWLRWEVRPWHGDGGTVDGIVMMVEDISERKRAQQELIRSEKQLTTELEVFQRIWKLGVTRVHDGDPNALAEEIVGAAVQITGACMSSLQALDHASGELKPVAHHGFNSARLACFDPSVGSGAACSMALARRERVVVEVCGGASRAEAPHLAELRKAGVGAVCATPLLTRSGTAIGVLCVCFRERHVMADREVCALDLLARQVADVMELAEAHKSLRDQRDYLSAILTAAVDAIITIDARGIIQSVNPETERVFGYAANEMVGRNVSMLMPAPYQAEHDGYIERYMKTGEARVIGKGREVRGLRRDGTEFPADLSVSRADHHDLFVGIIRDISARKEAEHKLRESERLASIGTLAAGLGHDMNNVLLPVRARLNALSAPDTARGLRAPLREHVEEINKSVAYLQQLADGLHFLTLDPETDQDLRGGGSATDLRLWWSQVGALLSKTVPKHVRITATIPEALPSVAVPGHALTQAVLNLFVNAGEAIHQSPPSPPAGGAIRLWASYSPGHCPPIVRLGVTDNGPGMTEDVRRRAFDIFFTTKPRGLGTGLGLALVRRVVDRAGGNVEIESAPGKGTTIVMTIPAVIEASEQSHARRAVISTRDGRAAALIRYALNSAGVSVTLADDPDGADIWIVDPGVVTPAAAEAWKRRAGRGQLVLLGPAPADHAAAWASMHPHTITSPDDLDCIFTAIHSAIREEGSLSDA